MPYYRRNLFVLSLTVFLSSVSWNQVVPFLQKFVEDMNGPAGSEWWVGLAASAQCLSAILAQPIWGKMGDSHGRKPMIIRAGICLTGVYFGMSLCRTPLQLVICRFANGALTGFIPGSFALIATNTPEEHAPRSMASLQVASSAGLILGPWVGAQLMSLFGSFRIAMVASGVAVMLCTLAVLILVQEPNKTRVTERTSLIEDFQTALRSRVQMAIIIGVMMAWFYGAAIYPYLIKYMEALQTTISPGLEGIFFSLPAVAFVLTARWWTGIGERIGYPRTIMVGVSGAVVCFAAMAFMPTLMTFAGAFLLTGFWLAAISPSTGALTVTRVEETFRGRAYGIQNALGTLAAMIAPLMAGDVIARFGMRWIFVMVALTFLVGLGAFKWMVGQWPREEAAPAEGEVADTQIA